MSLKGFHIVFLFCSVALCLGVAAWGIFVAPGPLFRALGGTALVCGVGLVFYGAWFLRKLRGVSSL